MKSYSNNINKTFRQHACPSNVGYMEAYMKHRFKYLGIKSPLRRELSKPFLSKDVRPDTNSVWKIIDELWELPEREYQYFALELLEKYDKEVQENWIDEFEKIIITKSWWDTVDTIAGNLVGNYFKKFPQNIPDITKKWMQSGNIWLQRSCLLFQLKYKDKTDTRLLSEFINQTSDSKEFFITKATGWSLRQYSKYNPGWVQKFVKENKLQPLSKREALRLM